MVDARGRLMRVVTTTTVRTTVVRVATLVENN